MPSTGQVILPKFNRSTFRSHIGIDLVKLRGPSLTEDQLEEIRRRLPPQHVATKLDGNGVVKLDSAHHRKMRLWTVERGCFVEGSLAQFDRNSNSNIILPDFQQAGLILDRMSHTYGMDFRGFAVEHVDIAATTLLTSAPELYYGFFHAGPMGKRMKKSTGAVAIPRGGIELFIYNKAKQRGRMGNILRTELRVPWPDVHIGLDAPLTMNSLCRDATVQRSLKRLWYNHTMVSLMLQEQVEPVYPATPTEFYDHILAVYLSDAQQREDAMQFVDSCRSNGMSANNAARIRKRIEKIPAITEDGRAKVGELRAVFEALVADSL